MEPDASPHLGPQSWIDAAYRAFEDTGVDGVRVDRLARALRVTRGSFYWHFENRGALLHAVLQRWDERRTEATIAANEARGGTPNERLLRLLETCADDDGRFEIGVRAWAAEDPEARVVVDRIDRRRTGYLTDLLVGCGVTTGEAPTRARVGYSAWLGTYIGAVALPEPERRNVVRCLFGLLTSDARGVDRTVPVGGGASQSCGT